MPLTAKERPTISVGDTEVISVNFTDLLDGSELLTGTPTVVEQTSSDLTIATVQVNTNTYTEACSGDTVAVGAAVQCKVSGGTVANSPYRIRVTCSSDATIARTFVRDVLLNWT